MNTTQKVVDATLKEIIREIENLFMQADFRVDITDVRKIILAYIER